jgi:hypothetical protein
VTNAEWGADIEKNRQRIGRVEVGQRFRLRGKPFAIQIQCITGDFFVYSFLDRKTLEPDNKPGLMHEGYFYEHVIERLEPEDFDLEHLWERRDKMRGRMRDLLNHLSEGKKA